MAEMGLQVRRKPRGRRTTNSQHGGPRFPNLVLSLVVEQPDQVWVADITYVRLHVGFVYLAVLMDVFTRCIRGWQLGRELNHGLTEGALMRALAHTRPKIHHSDQGVQYAAEEYLKRLQKEETPISMADAGAAWQNGYAERLIRTIKEEEVYLSEYQNYNDARRQLGRFLDDVYMHKRIHSLLGYLTPVEFESQWLAENQPEVLIPIG